MSTPFARNGEWMAALRAVRNGTVGASDVNAPLSRLLERALRLLLSYSWRRVRHLPDAQDVAEDIAQRAAIRIARSITSCQAESDGEFLSWMLTIAQHTIVDEVWLPRARLSICRSPLELTGATASYSFNAWAHQWDRAPGEADVLLGRLVCAALERLPEDTAQLVWDHVIHHSSWAATARTFRTTLPGAKRRYQRAQRTLRRLVLDAVSELAAAEREVVLRALADRARFPPASGETRRERPRGRAAHSPLLSTRRSPIR